MNFPKNNVKFLGLKTSTFNIETMKTKNIFMVSISHCKLFFIDSFNFLFGSKLWE